MNALSKPTSPFVFNISGLNPVLLVDDDDDAILLIQLLLKRSGITSPVHITTDGEKAMAYFEELINDTSLPHPQVVFLDLKLPRTSGLEVLKWISTHPSLATIPVMIMSSSNRLADMETSQSCGADFYCEKYPAPDQLVALFTGQKFFPPAVILDFG